jgi:hypothetical protein
MRISRGAGGEVVRGQLLVPAGDCHRAERPESDFLARVRVLRGWSPSRTSDPEQVPVLLTQVVNDAGRYRQHRTIAWLGRPDQEWAGHLGHKGVSVAGRAAETCSEEVVNKSRVQG